jgi:hypothetical protein
MFNLQLVLLNLGFKKEGGGAGPNRPPFEGSPGEGEWRGGGSIEP